MNSTERSAFEAIAESFGHRVDVLRSGSEVRSTISAPTVEAARGLLCRADTATRRERGKTFFDLIKPRLATIEGYHDKGNAFVFTDYELSDEERKYVDLYFPMDVFALSVEDKVLAPGEVWDLGTSQSAIAVNVGTLTMNPGSSVIVRNSVLSFTCQNLQKVPGPPPPGSPNYDFGILGLNLDEWQRMQLPWAQYSSMLDAGAVDLDLANQFTASGLPLSTNAKVQVDGSGTAWRVVDHTLMATYRLVSDLNPDSELRKINVFRLAMQGPDGGKGTEPQQAPGGNCKCSGGVPGDDGRDGYQGTEGGTGGTGVDGADGLPNLRADLVFSVLDLNGMSLVVQSRGGDGQQGGKGGTGGDGGRGGRGGDGAQCAATCTKGGNGGKGGQAGSGGTGGNGGNGANANDVYVTVPSDQASAVSRLAQTSKPGLAGPAGAPGQPGDGGDGGRAPLTCSDGGRGDRGDIGSSGEDGEKGDTGGLAARIFVNGNAS